MNSEGLSLRAAPPTGRHSHRQQTDDVVRSVDQSSSMADQSRQIKLAAAKKKVKYVPNELASRRESTSRFMFLRFCVVFIFVFLKFPHGAGGVVITRRPTSAPPLVSPLSLLPGLQCVGETAAFAGASND